MSSDAKRSTFDELVAGISADERKQLLNSLNQNREPEILILQSAKEDEGGFLDIKYKTEPLLYKFLLWLRSIFTKRSTKEIYNDDLIANLSHRINKNHPGILDIHDNLIQSLFYEKLKELKHCADFFKPYFQAVNDNPGKFYVFLSTFVAPEISEKINSEADPYTIPFDREVTSELKISLIKRMDNLIKNIEPANREKLYGAVRSLTWLKQFSELPYIHFSSQFTAIVSTSYTCPFINAQTDFPAFSRVLQDTTPIPKEALESLFLFTQRESLKHSSQNIEIENALREFMNKAIGCFSTIQMFVSTVPLSTLGKIIFCDYEWQPENQGGGEDWFVKFKEEWKSVFDQRWMNWLHDKKKNQLAEILSQNFGLSSFPELPYKPWRQLWSGITFHCEMTAGLLCWFVLNRSSEIMNVLNTIILEGIFIKKENRTELSEAINDFVDIIQQIQGFLESISPEGSIGSVFKKYEEDHVHSVKAQQLISSIILNAENQIRTCERVFCKSCQTIQTIFHGILDDVKDKNYASLQNLMTIKGPENRQFRENMSASMEILQIIRDVLVEIEPLDLPSD